MLYNPFDFDIEQLILLFELLNLALHNGDALQASKLLPLGLEIVIAF